MEPHLIPLAPDKLFLHSFMNILKFIADVAAVQVADVAVAAVAAAAVVVIIEIQSEIKLSRSTVWQ